MSDKPHGPALQVIMVGDDEDGQPIVKLTGSRDAVAEAGALFLRHVRLVPVATLVADDTSAADVATPAPSRAVLP